MAGLLIVRQPLLLTSGRSWPSPLQVSIPVLLAGLGQAAGLLVFLPAEERLLLSSMSALAFSKILQIHINVCFPVLTAITLCLCLSHQVSQSL